MQSVFGRTDRATRRPDALGGWRTGISFVSGSLLFNRTDGPASAAHFVTGLVRTVEGTDMTSSSLPPGPANPLQPAAGHYLPSQSHYMPLSVAPSRQLVGPSLPFTLPISFPPSHTVDYQQHQTYTLPQTLGRYGKWNLKRGLFHYIAACHEGCIFCL